METCPESYLKLAEIHSFNLYWARTHESFKVKALGMRDAYRTWQALRREYFILLSEQANLNTWDGKPDPLVTIPDGDADEDI